MKFGSLFTGVGGFDLGLERADFECAWQVERDPHCLEVLAEHYPNVERYTDVRTVGKHNLKPVDVICGGFPCQDVSIAGKRAGLAGERSGLWSEFARIIDELEPKWVVIENVPGLLSSNRGRDFATVIRWLAERRYGVAWRILDSQYFGVAQRRRRVFIVASLGNASCAEVLFESESVSGNIAKGGKAGEDIAYSIRANPSHSCDKGDGGINQTLVMSSGQANAEITNNQSPALTGLHEQPIIAVAYENHPADSRITETGNISQQLTSRMGTGGDNVPLVQAVGHSGGETLKFNEKVNTLNAQSGSETTAMFNGVMVSAVRRLTPTECERLQGFPDGWTAGQSDTQRYKQMGNAVTVNVIEWIGIRISNKEHKCTKKSC